MGWKASRTLTSLEEKWSRPHLRRHRPCRGQCRVRRMGRTVYTSPCRTYRAPSFSSPRSRYTRRAVRSRPKRPLLHHMAVIIIIINAARRMTRCRRLHHQQLPHCPHLPRSWPREASPWTRCRWDRARLLAQCRLRKAHVDQHRARRDCSTHTVPGYLLVRLASARPQPPPRVVPGVVRAQTHPSSPGNCPYLSDAR